MNKLRTAAFACLATVAIATTASAQVIAGNPVNGTLGGNNPYSTGITIEAMDFSLASSYDLTSLSHFGWHAPSNPQPSAVDWYIYDNNAGSPGSILFSGSSSYTSSVVGNAYGYYDVTKYTVSLTGVSLGAGDYWLGFHNEGVAYDPHWDITSFGGNGRRSYDEGLSWENSGYETSFEITGTDSEVTPEPASLVLLATGLVGVVAAARRRRK